MDYKNLISRIKSVRDYKKAPVSSDILKEIRNFYLNNKKLIENIETDIYIRDKEDIFHLLEGAAGYNDNMIEAPHYMIVLSEEKDYYIENTGYIVQKTMLKASESGVGSCWITFNDGDEIKERLMMDSEKKLTAIVALGYDDNKTKVVNDTVVQGFNPSKAVIKKVEDNVSYRLGIEELVFMNEWGVPATIEELSSRGLLDAFDYTRFAPSTLNRQPWRFIVTDEAVALAIRRDENINSYEDKIDTGIVMLYFEAMVDSTLTDITWIMGNTEKELVIPKDYTIVAYSNI